MAVHTGKSSYDFDRFYGIVVNTLLEQTIVRVARQLSSVRKVSLPHILTLIHVIFWQHIEFGSSADHTKRAEKVRNNQQALMDEMGKKDDDGKNKHDLVVTGPSHDILNNIQSNQAENSSNSSKRI